LMRRDMNIFTNKRIHRVQELQRRKWRVVNRFLSKKCHGMTVNF
jgi:hypothetical protein